MKRVFYLLGIYMLALGCSSGPDKVYIHVMPRTAEVTAGDSINLKATVEPDNLKNLKYTWKIDINCPYKLEGKGAQVVFKPDMFCFAQKVKVSVTVTNGKKSATGTRTITILESPQLPPRLSLHPKMDGWLIINNYNSKERLKKNSLGAAVSTWSYSGGICKTSIVDDALKISFKMAADESQCGTSEYLKGEEGKPQPYDITKYEKLSIKLKSADKKMHRVRVLFIEYDPMHTANQGMVAPSRTLMAFPGRWWRYEVLIKPTVGDLFDRSRLKSIAIKIDGKTEKEGAIMVDDLALIPKK